MTLYSYVVVHDAGFAPNPFGDFCTLATCKPKIRLRAQVGDWIVGAGSARNVGSGKLLYAMRVAEILPLEKYARDARFGDKVPKPKGSEEERCGDNIYYRYRGAWKQRESFHGPAEMATDLSGLNVLVSDHFYYFGRETIDVPARFSELTYRGRGYRNRFDDDLVNAFVNWLDESFETGIHGLPIAFQLDQVDLVFEQPDAKNCNPATRRPCK